MLVEWSEEIQNRNRLLDLAGRNSKYRLLDLAGRRLLDLAGYHPSILSMPINHSPRRQ
jgi:hypothetical protein